MPDHPYLWHPILVHFTVALLAASTFLYLVALLTKSLTWHARLVSAAELNLWIGAALTLLTVILGAVAYATVPHDEGAHELMFIHRTWGLITFAAYAVLALISIWHRKHARYPAPLFAVAMVVAMLALAETGLRGGNLVFDHGVGVEEPSGEAAEHHHEHHHE